MFGLFKKISGKSKPVCGRGASNKPKHSKVQKLIKLAKSRSKSKNKKKVIVQKKVKVKPKKKARKR